jgi:hypothetical protein
MENDFLIRSLSGRDWRMAVMNWKELVDELKIEWKTMWRERIDDRIRAEGIANKDYLKLFVERGLVIVATKDYKPLSFREILQRYIPPEVGERVIPPHPSVGGWRKFIKDYVNKPKQFTKRGRPVPQQTKHRGKQQLKKGGRGWLHFRME